MKKLDYYIRHANHSSIGTNERVVSALEESTGIGVSMDFWNLNTAIGRFLNNFSVHPRCVDYSELLLRSKDLITGIRVGTFLQHMIERYPSWEGVLEEILHYLYMKYGESSIDVLRDIMNTGGDLIMWDVQLIPGEIVLIRKYKYLRPDSHKFLIPWINDRFFPTKIEAD